MRATRGSSTSLFLLVVLAALAVASPAIASLPRPAGHLAALGLQEPPAAPLAALLEPTTSPLELPEPGPPIALELRLPARWTAALERFDPVAEAPDLFASEAANDVGESPSLLKTRVRVFEVFGLPLRPCPDGVSDRKATGLRLCLVESCGGRDQINIYAFVGWRPSMSVDPFGLAEGFPMSAEEQRAFVEANTRQGPARTPEEQQAAEAELERKARADLSSAASMTPVVSDVNDITQATTGYDPIAGTKLTTQDRIVATVAVAVPIVGAPVLKAVGKKIVAVGKKVRSWVGKTLRGGGDGVDQVMRVVEPGKPQFQLKPGEEGLSVFDSGKVSSEEVLPNFREGSETVTRTRAEIEDLGLKLECTPGDPCLPKKLQDAHMEIRPGEQMTRKEYKAKLKELEALGARDE